MSHRRPGRRRDGVRDSPVRLADSFVGRLLLRCLGAPALTAWLLLGIALVSCVALPSLVVSTDGRNLFATDHPALQTQRDLERDYAAEPEVILGLRTRGPDELYTTEVLSLLLDVTGRLQALPGVDGSGVLGLATVPSATSTPAGLRVVPPLEPPVRAPTDAARVRQRVAEQPLLRGTLVSFDEGSTAVYVPLVDGAPREAVVEKIEELWTTAVEQVDLRNGVSLQPHLLGSAPAEIALGEQVSQDLARLLPIVLVVVALALWGWFRSPSIIVVGLLQGLTVVLSSAALLTVVGGSLNLVTVIMPVILITYCLADTIHIGSRFAEKRRRAPSRARLDVMAEALTELMRPVVCTSLSTAAGFLAFAASPIPPLRAFGLATAFGIFVALVTSLLVVPAALCALGFDHDPRTARRRVVARRFLGGLALAAYRRPAPSLAVATLIVLAAGMAVSAVQVQDSWVANLTADSPVQRAEEWFNGHFVGSSVLAVAVTPRSPDGVLDPGFLGGLRALQERVQQLPAVGGSRSLADQLGVVGRALGKGPGLPGSLAEAAERRLLLEVAGDRAMLAPYWRADAGESQLRLFLNGADYGRTRRVLKTVTGFVEGEGSDRIAGIRLGGDAHLGHVLVQSITSSLLRSLAAALLAVLVVTLVMLRHPGLSLVAMVPVGIGLVAIFGVMGLTRTSLGVATSMFCAIALGVGVDFALHWLGRWRVSRNRGEAPRRSALRAAVSSGTGILAHALVLLAGFAVLFVSRTPPNRALGLLMCTNLLACAVATLWLLPALAGLAAPTMAGSRRSASRPAARDEVAVRPGSVLLRLLVGVVVVGVVLAPAPATTLPLQLPEEVPQVQQASANGPTGAEERLSGEEIILAVNRRDVGADARMMLEMTVRDARGVEHLREVSVLRKATPGGYRTVFRFVAPDHLRDIALLLQEDTAASDMWMYFPASDHLTRVVTRGLSALASDFSCEDLRVTFPMEDFEFRVLGEVTLDGGPAVRVEMIPASERLRRELGFHRAIGVVATDRWMIREADFFDARGEVFKSFRSAVPTRVDGVWILTRYSMVNHRAGHETRVAVRSAEHGLSLPSEDFEPEGLRRR